MITIPIRVAPSISFFEISVLLAALNPVIGYELGAKIAKSAYAESRAVIDVAEELTDLSRNELEKILDPMALTKGGITD